jgi:CheY-like chemotaxis protein
LNSRGSSAVCRRQEDRERTREAGFDYLLVKPVAPEKLQDLLIEVGKQQ